MVEMIRFGRSLILIIDPIFQFLRFSPKGKWDQYLLQVLMQSQDPMVATNVILMQTHAALDRIGEFWNTLAGQLTCTRMITRKLQLQVFLLLLLQPHGMTQQPEKRRNSRVGDK